MKQRLKFFLLKKLLLLFLLLIFTFTSIYIKESSIFDRKSQSNLNLNLILINATEYNHIEGPSNQINHLANVSHPLQSLINPNLSQIRLKGDTSHLLLSLLRQVRSSKLNETKHDQQTTSKPNSLATTTVATNLTKTTSSPPLKQDTSKASTNATKSDLKDSKDSKKPKSIISIIKNPKPKDCTPPAYKEFPSDIFGHSARVHGFIVVHILVVLYMFYCLAVVCDHYFLPSLEECSSRLYLSEDVAGATFMAAGSSAPELFTAILGVFVAKGDVGTGTIVGSAVFNILFVIGLCGVLTTATQLNWWPVARDSTYYIFSVFVLMLCIYDGEVSTSESALMLALYAVYIIIMHYNLQIRDIVVTKLSVYSSKPTEELNMLKNKNQSPYYNDMKDNANYRRDFRSRSNRHLFYEAANHVIIKHKRLFPAISRFRAAANLIIIHNQQSKVSRQSVLQSKFKKSKNTDSISGLTLMAKERIEQSPDIEHWRSIPNPVIEGWTPVIQWCIVAPVHAALFYTIPNCRYKQNFFLLTFVMSVLWIAIFSYIMVWMVTLIGFTYGIPDSIMGITFLAAGTSIPDAYASIHVAKMGQADMAVSNSIGSNVFDILIGLAFPWFIETSMIHRGKKATINSGGLLYAILLLFLSLIATIYLFHRNAWTLNPKLGTALLITYAVFLVLCSAIEMNLIGYVNPVMCED